MTDCEPFEKFWRELGGNGMWRFTAADRALHVIYCHGGVEGHDERFIADRKRVQAGAPLTFELAPQSTRTPRW